MKQITLSLALAIACFGFAKADVVINATNFPNLNFRVWVAHNVDLVNDGVLTDEEIANITEIDTYIMNFNNISDITGIEFLTDLERLNITNTTESQRVCSITNVDLSQNKKLKHFTFSRTSTAAPALSSLNIANLPELETISITQASITELDCSGCANLKSISVPRANLKSIKLDGCASLETLNCRKNQFSASTLKLNDLPNLTTLCADSCELTDIELSSCLNLQSVNLAGNHIPNLTLPPVKDISKDSNLNQYTELPWKWISSDMAEMIMPETFDPSRLNYYAANAWNFEPFYYPTALVSSKTFVDSLGNQRLSFIVSRNFSCVNNRGIFFYRYIANPPQNTIVSTVQVIGGYLDKSGVEDVSTEKVVSGVRYFDLQGHESADPFNGFNIEVTHYTDGTSQSKKFIR